MENKSKVILIKGVMLEVFSNGTVWQPEQNLTDGRMLKSRWCGQQSARSAPSKRSMNLRPHLFVKTDGIYDDELKKKFLPINGISDSLIVNCLESKEWQIYKSDRFGFNNQV